MTRSTLFTSLRVGEVDVPNRVWMPPMCMYSARSAQDVQVGWGQPTDFHMIHYGARAKGGVGAVIVEATGVVPEGRISVNCLSLHSDDQIPAFTRLAQMIHEGGAKAFVQLIHAGRKASTKTDFLGDWHIDAADGGWETVGASAVDLGDDIPVPRELTEEDLEHLPALFAAAARRAMEAGFDGVQIHGAHGYLLHQFLSPATNQRSDGWGGSFEGRTRLLREVVQAVRPAIGEGALMVRLSATDWTAEYPEDGRPGWTLDDTVRLGPLLVDDGADALCISSGGNIGDAKIPWREPGYQVFLARAVREGLRSAGLETPVSVAGAILDADQAEEVLASGSADAVEVGRPLLTDPMLPHVWRTRLGEEPDFGQPAGMPLQYRRGAARA
ncbi:MAG: NADH:flavin oxidoreductase/NADH oxidase [Actinomycetaceae bacterium]|nr:NADH:flavin oxidoreductase/NADH oxidase [Actinomycetaceae bacterium]